jgi:hypothetical protein
LIKRGYVKRVFPGNNTPMGFFSYYDYILPKDSRRIYVIKGGPGVGKSTFMTSIAKYMVDLGYDVEVHHCSSDNNSIDGVVFPAIGVGILDGTSPHVVDPKVPGAVDEIVWLGEFWDEDAVRAKKKEILQAQRGIESVFGAGVQVSESCPGGLRRLGVREYRGLGLRKGQHQGPEHHR